MCLSSDATQNICLGISAGDEIVNRQLTMRTKPRLDNIASNQDGFKQRFDVDYLHDTITMSLNPDFCMQGRPSGEMWMDYCNSTRGTTLWDTTVFEANIKQEGKLVHTATGLVATVMFCEKIPVVRNGKKAFYCAYWPSKKTMIRPADPKLPIPPGSPIRLWPALPKLDALQTFRQRLDCSPGCSPFDEENDVCDVACLTAACNFDRGHCTAFPTISPTPPTSSPTAAPWTSSPSMHPATESPSRHPATTSPSRNPSLSPTTSKPSKTPSKAPTTTRPSKNPSRGPTKGPTTRIPSSAPTKSPTRRPTKTPSASPTTLIPTASPTPNITLNVTAAVVALSSTSELWWIGVALLILLCLCFCCPVVDRRYVIHGRIKSLPKSEPPSPPLPPGTRDPFDPVRETHSNTPPSSPFEPYAPEPLQEPIVLPPPKTPRRAKSDEGMRDVLFDVPPAHAPPTPPPNAQAPVNDDFAVPMRWVSQRIDTLNIHASSVPGERPHVVVKPPEIARKASFRRTMSEVTQARPAVPPAAVGEGRRTSALSEPKAKPPSVRDLKSEISRLGGHTDDCVERADLVARLADLRSRLPVVL